jgi:hypothetical protein
MRWLNKNARPGTGFGRLLPVLQQKALRVSATDILGSEFATRVAKNIAQIRGWNLNDLDKAVLLTEVDFYDSFISDLKNAHEKVILYTPFIGKTRWPQFVPFITQLRERSVEVYLLHKPLTDTEWRRGDPEFGRSVFSSLASMGVNLIPISGVHAKTIVIDSNIVYEGSLNWASQTASYEHMWRFKSADMAKLVERMLQIEPIAKAFGKEDYGDVCPHCRGPLILINQAQQINQTDQHSWKLGCARWAQDKNSCRGYLRRVDGRPPFVKPPACPLGSLMRLNYAKSGRPWDWRCDHRACRPIRWVRGDCED